MVKFDDEKVRSPVYILYNINSENVDVVDFDIVSAVDYNFESEISQFPLEDGSVFSDHILNKPQKISFMGSITNSPFSNARTEADGRSVSNPLIYPTTNVTPRRFGPIAYPDYNQSFRAGDLNVAGGIQTLTNAILDTNLKPQPTRSEDSNNKIIPSEQPASNFVIDNDRVQEVFDTLMEIRDSKQVTNIVTPNRYYYNMAIVNISSPISVDSGNSMEFSISAEEIRTVKTFVQQTPVPAELIAARKQAAGSKNGGGNKKKTAQDSQSNEETKRLTAEAEAKQAEIKARRERGFSRT